jgi:hypothetical protein
MWVTAREREVLADRERGRLPRGSPVPLDAKLQMTRGRDLQISRLQKELSSRSSFSTWSVCKGEKKRRREKHGVRSSRPKFKFGN